MALTGHCQQRDPLIEANGRESTANMLTLDLHYHANVAGLPRTMKRRRLLAHRRAFERSRIDYVASTEHAYKKPLDAYLYLSDVSADIDTTIIPGVEWISKEGIDMIFLFPTEKALKDGLKVLRPFSHDVEESNRLKQDIGAITLIPHPVTPGRTGLATALGNERYCTLQEDADYIEVHNGSILNLLQNTPNHLQRSKKQYQMVQRAKSACNLPSALRSDNVGWAVNSDAHFPGQQYVVGETEEEIENGDWFSFLQRKIKFRPRVIGSPPVKTLETWYDLVRGGRCVVSEVVRKSIYRSRAGL